MIYQRFSYKPFPKNLPIGLTSSPHSHFVNMANLLDMRMCQMPNVCIRCYMYAILKSGQDLLKFSNNSFIMVSAYGRIAAKRLVYAYLGTCMPCPCAEILDKGWDANKPQAKKEVIEDAPRPRRIFHCALPRVFQPN